MKHLLTFVLIWLWVWPTCPLVPTHWDRLMAQEENPARSYRLDELISLTPEVPFNTAMDILGTFAQRFENRIVIGAQSITKPIGVSVENMHWKRALEYILRSNMMQYTQQPKYYEIVPLEKQKPKEEEAETITIATREIEINAVFFQADYETLHAIGVNWSTLKDGKVEVQFNGADEVAQNIFSVSGGGTIRGSVRVAALLKLFESKSRGEIIARPQIRVMDGEKGKIKVGKNFYLTVSDFAGNARNSEYESGVILTVTPTLKGRRDSTFIHLDITAERSDVQPDVIGVTKNITQSQTQVLLLNGEETAIAGLLTHETQKVRKGIPVLKDLPWWFLGLRYLFGNESTKLSKKELVVLIEARIVNSLLSRKGSQFKIKEYFDGERREFEKYQDPPQEPAKPKAKSTGQNGSTKKPVRRSSRK